MPAPPDSPFGLAEVVERAVAEAGTSRALDPGHRVPFVWPPHPVSADFHVPPSLWRETGTVEAYGETYVVETAVTEHGVFGRLDQLWNEVRVETVSEVPRRLREGAEPFFARRLAMAKALGTPGRPFRGSVRELDASGLVRLLYCQDRDVAHEAMLEIETRASAGEFTDALIWILEDDRHPYRRIAQWCVLDMLEDLPAVCPTPESQERAVEAVRRLLWSAEDDFARAVYKAGVVLGGHVCTEQAAHALLDCIQAPSRYGRRSAIHAVFHLVEWAPHYRDRVLEALDGAAESDAEPLLRRFAATQRRDIAAGELDHVAEPRFPEEESTPSTLAAP